MVERRETGEPLQYVLERWPFRQLELFVDRRVLIPRPETEVVVDARPGEHARVGRPRGRPRHGVGCHRPLGGRRASRHGGVGGRALAPRPGRGPRQLHRTGSAGPLGPAARGLLVRPAARRSCAARWASSRPTRPTCRDRRPAPRRRRGLGTHRGPARRRGRPGHPPASSPSRPSGSLRAARSWPSTARAGPATSGPRRQRRVRRHPHRHRPGRARPVPGGPSMTAHVVAADRTAPRSSGAEALLGGGLVVLPTDTVYGLAALAPRPRRHPGALRPQGSRRRRPVAVLCADADQALALAGAHTAGAPTLLRPTGPARSPWWCPAARTWSGRSASRRTPSACAAPTTTSSARSPAGWGRSPPPAPTATACPRRHRPSRRRPQLLGAVDLVIDGGTLSGTPSTVVDAHRRDGPCAAPRAGRSSTLTGAGSA